jgi:hypothetical protein
MRLSSWTNPRRDDSEHLHPQLFPLQEPSLLTVVLSQGVVLFTDVGSEGGSEDKGSRKGREGEGHGKGWTLVSCFLSHPPGRLLQAANPLSY